jgi:2,4-dienoyl-CoA reductase (NADPH2)
MHREVTQAVHSADPDVKICMQILHSGPLAGVPDAVAPSPVKSRIGRYAPVELDEAGIEEQIDAFARCAALAQEAGYDGVEIIGSAGYLISTFLVEKTNLRTDQWGGSWENRMRFALEVVRRTRAAVGPDFVLIFRISAMDMLEGGLAWEEVASLARGLEAAGVDVISTHFCWHESFVPTIATMVPRAAFAQVTGRLRKEVSVPIITSNRINMPDVAEAVLARGDADLVSMARPMLADAELVKKAYEGREDEINTCIGCNQACLDHTFTGRETSCLVNARACRETELTLAPAEEVKRIAVVGAGPAGLAYATLAAERGHSVTLFDAADEIGGQFNLAKRIPGKEEFYETLRYFERMVDKHGVDLRLNTRVSADDLLAVGKALGGKSVGDLEHGAASALATAAPCPAVPSPACAVPSPACVPCRRQTMLHCACRSHCQRWHNGRACKCARGAHRPPLRPCRAVLCCAWRRRQPLPAERRRQHLHARPRAQLL